MMMKMVMVVVVVGMMTTMIMVEVVAVVMIVTILFSTWLAIINEEFKFTIIGENIKKLLNYWQPLNYNPDWYGICYGALLRQ